MKEFVSVEIDIHEDEIIPLFAAHPEVEDYLVKPLPDGDIIVADSVIIERKTQSDFVNSIQKDRLFPQIREMAKSDYDFPFVFVEDELTSFENMTHSNMRPQAIRGVCASSTIRYGVPIIFCGSQENLVDMAVRFGRKSVESESTTAFSERDAIPDAELSQTARMYVAIDSIGPKGAMALAEKYPTVSRLMTASVDDIMEISGFGEKRAEEVYRVLREV